MFSLSSDSGGLAASPGTYSLLEDTQLVRRLPVISETYLNPESVWLKKQQEDAVAVMAQPQDNPWYARLMEEYMGKILYAQKA
jgi:hypothetical protein